MKQKNYSNMLVKILCAFDSEIDEKIPQNYTFEDLLAFGIKLSKEFTELVGKKHEEEEL